MLGVQDILKVQPPIVWITSATTNPSARPKSAFKCLIMSLKDFQDQTLLSDMIKGVVHILRRQNFRIFCPLPHSASNLCKMDILGLKVNFMIN